MSTLSINQPASIALPERRSLAAIITDALERLDAWLERADVARREAYLDQSLNSADLERRLISLQYSEQQRIV